MDDCIECIICLETYSLNNIPQLLPCSHMICDICISTLPTNELECPMCRISYSKSQINPNFGLISKIIKSKLEEIIQPEIDKQLHCVDQLDQTEYEVMKIFSIIRKQLNEAIDFNLIAKEQILNKVQEDIAVLSDLSKELRGRPEEIVESFKRIAKKCQEKNNSVTLKGFNTSFLQNNISKYLESLQKNSEVYISKKTVSLLGKDLVDLVYKLKPCIRKENKYLSKFLFCPYNRWLKIYDMEQKHYSGIEDSLIRPDSKFIHLHPDTVVVVTNENIIFINIDHNNTILSIPFRLNWEGFCLGRHNGDLAIIGGTRQNEKFRGREAWFLYKKKDWQALPELNEERIDATSQCIYKKIYVFGGNQNRTVEMFYLNTWTVLNVKLELALSHIVLCTDFESIYLIGGKGFDSRISNSIYKFKMSSLDLKLLDSTEHGIMNASNVSACCINKQIFYNVGEDIYQYDLKFN